MRNSRLVMGAFLFLSAVPICLIGPARATERVWTTFTSRAGWTLKYPPNWRVGSCNNCSDATAPNVFVSFFDPSTSGMVRIERLKDKPADHDITTWLNHIEQTAVANPRLSEQWVSLAGRRALLVKTHNPDSTESENVYVVDQSKTFFIQAAPIGDATFYSTYKRMLSSFRFATH